MSEYATKNDLRMVVGLLTKIVTILIPDNDAKKALLQNIRQVQERLNHD